MEQAAEIQDDLLADTFDGIPNSSAIIVTALPTSPGSIGLLSRVTNGPSVSVRRRSNGTSWIARFPLSEAIIPSFTEKKQPRSTALRTSALLPANQ